MQKDDFDQRWVVCACVFATPLDYENVFKCFFRDFGEVFLSSWRSHKMPSKTLLLSKFFQVGFFSAEYITLEKKD